MITKRRGFLYAAGAVLSTTLVVSWALVSNATVEAAFSPDPEPALAAYTDPAAPSSGGGGSGTMSMADLAAADPLRFTETVRDRFDKRSHEYRCTLIKRERIGGKLKPEEHIEVRYRSEPRETIYMIWKKNVDQVRRALYINGHRDYVNRKGEKLARVEPNGAIVRLFTRDVMIEIDGSRARKASRRSIANCGFAGTFRLLDRFNSIASKNGDLDYRYEGEGTIDGRPTFVLVRYLPKKRGRIRYPDGKMIMHVDQEYLVPTAVFSYADRQGTVLQGSYQFINIDMDPRFTDRDFKF